ncbi:outer dynein arm-docking complex subunit 4 isoform X1 [Drosophila virilis]|uniref:Uncharacterized protein n=2 Tax=Drosophila virilis TaxID=7244 RepID=B4M4H5_DROVI|nr:uncharacterized protein LOC6632525 isoform X1 [Drosophila virilis]EDW59536.2 uncharacterized protein Dvir_GJ10942 [Drosophila virilis]
MSQSAELYAPSAGVQKHLEPWQVLKWTDGQLRAMYTDWGSYFVHRQNLHAGSRYFDAALEIDPNDTKVLLRRSQIKRKVARAPEALIDCLKAKDTLKRKSRFNFDPEINLEICDALYESNKFEDAKRNLHYNLRLFCYSQARPLLNRLSVVNGNIHDALSDETAPAVHILIDKMTTGLAKQPTYVKPDCDVLSILEKEEEFLSPLEKKRRERRFKTYSQAYLNKSWMDVSFLKSLRENPSLLLKESVESTKYLKRLANEKYKTVRTFTKMLHARCPMYSKHIKTYPNNELYLKNQEENFFRIQYQTRRNMFKILRTIRALISKHELKKLTKFVDEVTGDYVTIKTHRIMPWKFEFINEVYNYLGLARINEYKISSALKTLSGRTRLLNLLKIPIELGTAANVKLNNIMQIKREQLVDPKAEIFKQRIARFESRMRFAKYPIERSYLYHEAAQANLDNHSFDTCCLLARKSMDEAIKGNSYVWAALSALIACKAHTVLGKVERQKEMLTIAFKYAKRLKNIDLILFIDICLKVNSEEMELKKALIASEGSGKRRVRRSLTSLDASIDNSPVRNSKAMIHEVGEDQLEE